MPRALKRPGRVAPAGRAMRLLALYVALLAGCQTSSPTVTPPMVTHAQLGPAQPPPAKPTSAASGAGVLEGLGPVGTAVPAAVPVAEPEDLATYCDDVDNHFILGTRVLRDLEAQLETGDPNPSNRQAAVGRVQLNLDLGMEYLRQARFDEMMPYLDEALRLAGEIGLTAETQAKVRMARAVAEIRRGEAANCLSQYRPFMCILFTGPVGAYTDTTDIDNAIADLEVIRQTAPTLIGPRWLMNVAYMLIGQYPAEVPTDWRIPTDRFQSAHQAPRYVDISRDLGVENIGLVGGSIMEDFDNDGNLDLFTTSYHPCEPSKLFHNNGDGRFSDVSAAAGLENQLGGFTAFQTDFDNDGWVDLFVVRGGWQMDDGRQRRTLLHNNGDGTFTDVSLASGLAGPGYPTQAAAWADYDNDGDLDVYVGAEVNNAGEPYPSQLFRNDGDGTFTEVAVEAGVTNDRFAKGVAWGDYDNDRDPDLFVSNIGSNRLYRNDGDGTFTDVAAEAGVIEPSGRSFVPWFFDYDNDGLLDLFVAGYDATVEEVALDYLGMPPERPVRPALYHNDGGGRFTDVALRYGLNRVLLPMGANFGDIDNDGWPDIYLGTGDPSFWTLVPDVMFWNDHGRRFVDVTASAGVGHLPKGHGVAFGDLDNDGDQDIYLQAGGFVPGDAQPNALFENPGAGNHWLTLRLVGHGSNRPAIGARVTVTVTAETGERAIHKVVSTGGSFGGNSLQQEIGLGAANRVGALEVYWPTTDTRQVFTDLAVDTFYALREDAPTLDVEERQRIELYRVPGWR